MILRKTLKWTFKILGVFCLLILLYFIAAFSLSSIAVNKEFNQTSDDAVDIHILTNGVHTDIVLPYKNEYMDWSHYVNPITTKSGDTIAVNVAFGWGDKGFYLQTKTWDDLKFSTAFKAMFYLSTSAMHVTFYKNLKEDESCKKIRISKQNYLMLVNYIKESFSPDNNGSTQQISDASYSNNDAFYEAKGKYSLFFTCNSWANSALKSSNLKACLWTPFDWGIFNMYSE